MRLLSLGLVVATLLCGPAFAQYDPGVASAVHAAQRDRHITGIYGHRARVYEMRARRAAAYGDYGAAARLSHAARMNGFQASRYHNAEHHAISTAQRRAWRDSSY